LDGVTQKPPLLVVVTGMPAGGKSTLANELSLMLALPLIARDGIKEQLYETLGAGDTEWSSRLGRASFGLLFDLAATLLDAGQNAIVEANFFRGDSEQQFAALPDHGVTQIHCSAPLELLVARYTGRRRHHGHPDEEKVELLGERFDHGTHEPLALAGDLIRVDTSRPVDLTAIATRLRRSL
jgi:predicted kinase